MPFWPLARSTACSPSAFVRAYLSHIRIQIRHPTTDTDNEKETARKRDRETERERESESAEQADTHSCENDDGYGISSSVCPVTSPP